MLDGMGCNKRKLVSIIIPTYNGARFIRETLGSVFGQTRLPDHVIVVDDASSDGTADLVDQIAREAPIPLTVIRLRKNTGGPATPLNIGIDAAQAEFIGLLDHDDVILPKNLALKEQALCENDDVDFVFGDYESFSHEGPIPRSRAADVGGDAYALISESGGPVYRVLPEVAIKAFIMRPGLARGCSNMFFRKTAWKAAGGFRARTGAISDHDFLLRAVTRPIIWLNTVLFRRRVHDTNLWKPTRTNRVSALRSQRRILSRYPDNPELCSLVTAKIWELTRRFRWEHDYWGSYLAAVELARIGKPVQAAIEILKTSVAIPRDVVLGLPAEPGPQY